MLGAITPRKKLVNKSKYKISYYPGCVMSIHVACLCMCVLFYLSFVCLYVCTYAVKFKVHGGSAFEPGTSRLPYYCTPPVCVHAVIGGLTVWRHNKTKHKTKTQYGYRCAVSKKERKKIREAALTLLIACHSRRTRVTM